jgi:hypothetical protein
MVSMSIVASRHAVERLRFAGRVMNKVLRLWGGSLYKGTDEDVLLVGA